MTAQAARLRPVRPGEADRLAALNLRCWRETYAGLVGPAALDPASLPGRRRRWRRMLARPAQGGAAIVAELGGEPVGYGLCGPQREDDRLADAEIYALYLLRRAQGRGLGRALMRAMTQTLRAWGATSLDVWALERNPAAVGFYRALGGEPEARRRFRIAGRTVWERAFLWPDLTAARF